MGGRPYLSIGEVLNLLRGEFPDVTISKIRFLESQGLLDPERTPSGYRKFYDEDVERLRWILRQQKENFLPLRVIKDRLDPTAPSDGDGNEEFPEAAASAQEPADAPAGRQPAGEQTAVPPVTVAPPPAPTAVGRQAGEAAFTLDELAAESGLDPDELKELERFGLIESRLVAGTTYYDLDALIVAAAAAGFRRFGVEARHLRLYKTTSEREAGLFEQIVTPLLRQRNPEARQRAADNVGELVGLGAQLHSVLLRRALRGVTGT
ncbi:MAG TPA: MerR family transcriptional regulator [Acidimicrobiales bacterium]|nr:MerR family transcriptional regulator [Acidimicrobiales bacterium]